MVRTVMSDSQSIILKNLFFLTGQAKVTKHKKGYCQNVKAFPHNKVASLIKPTYIFAWLIKQNY